MLQAEDILNTSDNRFHISFHHPQNVILDCNGSKVNVYIFILEPCVWHTLCSLFQHSFFLQPVALGGLCALSLLNLIIHADYSSATPRFFFPLRFTSLSAPSFRLSGLFLFPIVYSEFLFSERAITTNID